MFGLLPLIIRRSLRNAPLTLAVLVGLLALVTLMAAAPLYTSALADVGLRTTLVEAPLDQRSVRVALPTGRLQQTEHERWTRLLAQAAQPAAWLKPAVLSAKRTKQLYLPSPQDDAERSVALVEADTAMENLRVTEGRLPEPTGADAPLEVVLGTDAARQWGISAGDHVALAEVADGQPLIPGIVVGLVEPADRNAAFWQSGVLDLELAGSKTREEASMLVAPGMFWRQVASRLPAERASGEYQWRTIFDITPIDGGNAFRAEADVGRVLRATKRALPAADVRTDFGGIVAGYRQRLSVARAPILGLLCEIAGLALIYIGWTAAFQIEASAGEQAVMGARGARMRQIVALSGGQAALLAAGAALAGAPLALLLLRLTTRLGPVAALARTQGFRLVATPDVRAYVLGASGVGLLALALPVFPAARRSIVALRQGSARPPRLPLWQRAYLDLVVMALAVVAFVQLQRQGTVLQRLRGQFVVDPFLILAPLLILVAGVLLFLRAYPVLLNWTRGRAERLRGLPLALSLFQLSRNRAASTRLVLLLSLAVAHGLFALTFGAALAFNHEQRAGYLTGAEARALLTSAEPLLPGALPDGVRSTWALRDTIKVAGGRGVAGTLLAVDPEHFASVAYNPADHPVAPVAIALQTLGPTPPPDGIAIPGHPTRFSLFVPFGGTGELQLGLILSDAAGQFHRLSLNPEAAGPGQERTFSGKLDLPAAAYPLRLTAIALLPFKDMGWKTGEYQKPPATIVLGPLTADGVVVERWGDGRHTWDVGPDTTYRARDIAAGVVGIKAPGTESREVSVAFGLGMRAAMLWPEAHDTDPIPVEANESFLRANRLRVGDTTLFLFRNRLLKMRIAGLLPRFPTLGVDDAPFVVAHGPRLLRQLNRSYTQPAAPNELWLDLPDRPVVLDQVRATPGIGSLLLQSAMLGSLSQDPLAVGIAGVFFLGFVVSLLLTLLGFAIATYLAGRRRVIEFAVLQALGLDRRAVLLTLGLEQGVLVLLALLAGSVLGIAQSRLILPLLAVSDRGRAVVPPYVMIVPWGPLAATYAMLIALFAITTALVLWVLIRRGLGSALRIGEE